MKQLIVLCGVSHAGKTTYATNLNKDNEYIIVNTDNIRIELHGSRAIFPKDETMVWEIFDKRRKQAIRSGNNIILDACHISKAARYHAIKDASHYHRKAVVFNPNLEELKMRWKKDNRIKWCIIENMFRTFSYPDYLEGFDEIEEII